MLVLLMFLKWPHGNRIVKVQNHKKQLVINISYALHFVERVMPITSGWMGKYIFDSHAAKNFMINVLYELITTFTNNIIMNEKITSSEVLLTLERNDVSCFLCKKMDL